MKIKLLICCILILCSSCAHFYTYTIQNVDTGRIDTEWSTVGYNIGDTIVVIPSMKRFLIIDKYD